MFINKPFTLMRDTNTGLEQYRGDLDHLNPTIRYT